MKQSPEHSNRLITRRRVLGAAAAGLALTALDGGIYSSNLKIERHTLRLPRWDADGFKIAQVSDFHLNHAGARDRALQALQLAMAFKADVLVFTGDFLNEVSDTRLKYVKQVFDLVGDAGCPSFAVTGNHDYSCKGPGILFETVASTPIKLLQNRIAEVRGVSIAGFDDAYFGHARFGLTASRSLSQSTVALLHEPDYVSQLRGHPSLVLSGHSHGGEICLPGGIPMHTPDGAKTYTAGFYDGAAHPLYVSRGVATLGPFRMFCPPEVTLLTLYGA